MLYLIPPENLGEHLAGEPPYRARQLERWLYRTPVLSAATMTDLPRELREQLHAQLWPFEVAIERTADEGATRKWLFRTPGGTSIETVLMGYRRRTTLCISSQAGCAMGCTFCATGQFGFERHLEPGEIVAQVAYARASLSAQPAPTGPATVSNVVFMGMGEPLANYRRVREALRRMIETMGMSPRSITVSTVGIVPGIRKLAEEPWPLNLAISLHATEDEARSAIVPINDRYPIAQLIDAARAYFERKGRRVTIEWTLIAGRNDDVGEARRLAQIAHRMRAHVNVIPLNPTPFSADAPPPRHVLDRFVETLRQQGVTTTVRDTRGAEIDAACGQLRVRASQPARVPAGAPASLTAANEETPHP